MLKTPSNVIMKDLRTLATLEAPKNVIGFSLFLADVRGLGVGVLTMFLVTNVFHRGVQLTLVNVYVDLVVFTRIAGTS